MFILNGTLLLILVFALHRLFGPVIALGALLYLAIDPTVAAHLPVVMTDLSVSLRAASGAVVLAIPAFRNWSIKDFALCSGTLSWFVVTPKAA